MSSYEKLKRIHASSGVYKVIEGSNIANELRAYSAGLDLLADALSELESECFISTSQSYGIERRELMFGAVRVDLPVASRRNMLLKRSAFGEGDFTPEGIGKVLEFLGVQGEVREYPALNRVTIEVENKGLTKGQRNWIVSQISELFPAHLEVDTAFEGFSWEVSDNRNRTFDEMERFLKTWQEIDYYCI